MSTQSDCSQTQLAQINTDNFCSDSFCPAANLAWPYELNALCKQLVLPFFLVGEVQNVDKVPSAVSDFCNKYKESITNETAVNSSGCTFSVLYEHMIDKCRSQCVERSWACLVPQSYCYRVANKGDAIASTLKYFGDFGSRIDTSGIQMYNDEHECNRYCLASTNGGLPSIT